jgi:hypothetical protein
MSPKILTLEEIKRRKALKEQQDKPQHVAIKGEEK